MKPRRRRILTKLQAEALMSLCRRRKATFGNLWRSLGRPMRYPETRRRKA